MPHHIVRPFLALPSSTLTETAVVRLALRGFSIMTIKSYKIRMKFEAKLSRFKICFYNLLAVGPLNYMFFSCLCVKWEKGSICLAIFKCIKWANTFLVIVPPSHKCHMWILPLNLDFFFFEITTQCITKLRFWPDCFSLISKYLVTSMWLGISK